MIRAAAVGQRYLERDAVARHVQMGLAQDKLAVAQHGIRRQVRDGSNNLGRVSDRFVRLGGESPEHWREVYRRRGLRFEGELAGHRNRLSLGSFGVDERLRLLALGQEPARAAQEQKAHCDGDAPPSQRSSDSCHRPNLARKCIPEVADTVILKLRRSRSRTLRPCLCRALPQPSTRALSFG